MVRYSDTGADTVDQDFNFPPGVHYGRAIDGNGDQTSERAVDVQVNRLRRKIESNPANPLFVQTVRGIGYRLVSAP